MAVKQAVKFVASDGKEFDNLQAAEAHEAVLGNMELIARYASERSEVQQGRTRIINTILDWEQYKAAQGLGEVEEVVEKAAA